MNNYNNSKLELIVNLFNNVFHKQKLIIFIGTQGVTLSALKKHQVKDSIFIGYGETNFEQKCFEFLINYKKFYIIFLLDHEECKIKHEIMPYLSSIIKSNPIKKFISENYKPEDIVAYNIYEISNSDGEVWKSCIASVPYIHPISTLLECVLNNSFKYSGMYFLSLEMEIIIERLLHKTQHVECSDHLQIFVVVTEASDIRLIVKYKNDIMDEQVIDYPDEKSDEYTQGTIQQAVSDKLLFYKEYIKKLEINTCIIFLGDTTLIRLLEKLPFPESKIIAISGNDIALSNNHGDKRFQDNILIELFDNFNTHLALNTSLKSITKLTLANKIIFKPLIALIFGLVVTLGTLQYQNLAVQKETSAINQQYYSLSENYRDIKKRYPNLGKVSDLVDLYNLESLISRKSITPFADLKNFFTTNNNNLKIQDIKWKILDPQNINLPTSHVNISIDLTYEGPLKSSVQGISILNVYADYLKAIFLNHQVTYKRDSVKITQLAKKIIIPATIIIDGKVESTPDVK